MDTGRKVVLILILVAGLNLATGCIGTKHAASPPPLPPFTPTVSASFAAGGFETNASPSIVFVMAADWAPSVSTDSTVYFQFTDDSRTWTKFYEVPYPTNGATITVTNVSSQSLRFYRAGTSIP